MAIPPVVQRSRQKQLSEDEIRIFVRKRIGSTETRFRELNERFLKNVEDAAWRLVTLPTDDRYWEKAYPSENFMDAIYRYLKWRCEESADDEPACWGFAGLSAHWTNDETSFGAWSPLIRSDPRSVRWLIEAAFFILEQSGHDSSGELADTLIELVQAAPNLVADLRTLTSDTDRRLANASRAALGVLGGRSLGEFRESYHEQD